MDVTCESAGCAAPVYVRSRRLCRRHYGEWWDEQNPRVCTVDGCGQRHEAHGYCVMHVRRWKLYGDPLGVSTRTRARLARTPQLCAIEGCTARQYGRGWCANHYARWRRHGALHDKRATRTDPVERFWAKVDKTATCWLWTGPLNGSGYGSFNLTGKTVGAHVAALLIAGIDVPLGMVVHHVCRVRHCVNPVHLTVTTQAENTRLSQAHRPKFSRRVNVSRAGSVYYVAMGEFIKIGYARDVPQRVRLIRYGFKADPPKTIPVRELRLLTVHAGGSAAEQALHRRFADARVEGEWFRSTPELLDHIARIVARRRRNDGRRVGDRSA